MLSTQISCARCAGLGWIRVSDGSTLGYRDKAVCPECLSVGARENWALDGVRGEAPGA